MKNYSWMTVSKKTKIGRRTGTGVIFSLGEVKGCPCPLNVERQERVLSVSHTCCAESPSPNWGDGLICFYTELSSPGSCWGFFIGL